jgi:hypothetical protein
MLVVRPIVVCVVVGNTPSPALARDFSASTNV